MPQTQQPQPRNHPSAAARRRRRLLGAVLLALLLPVLAVLMYYFATRWEADWVLVAAMGLCAAVIVARLAGAVRSPGPE